MRFKDFDNKTSVTNKGVFKLSPHIPHMEDLDALTFYTVLQDFHKYRITEKVDGANIVFGFENDGTFYTSREAKRGKRLYKQSDYQMKPANNSFRAAHTVLEHAIPFLKGVMENGDACECEVLYGRQPNAIVYGSNRIVFLRMIPGDNGNHPDNEKIHRLGEFLQEATIYPTTPFVGSKSGDYLTETTRNDLWLFSTVPHVDPSLFEDIEFDILKQLYEDFVNETRIGNSSVLRLCSINLTSIPKDDRDEYREWREEARKLVKEEQTRIKEHFVKKLHEIQPKFRDIPIEDHEDNGIEGIVLLNPETHHQFKIVDRNTFTEINNFNFAIRSQVKTSSRGRPVFENAKLWGSNTDLYNFTMQGISSNLGAPSLSHVSNIGSTLKRLKGQTIEETIDNVVNIIDPPYNPECKSPHRVAMYIKRLIKHSLLMVEHHLREYKSRFNEYHHTLPNGKVLKYNDEINDRTLSVFAETKMELEDILHSLQTVVSYQDIVYAVYHQKLEEIHG